MAYTSKTIDFKGVNDKLMNDPWSLMDRLGLKYRRAGKIAYVKGYPASGDNSFVVFCQSGTFKDFSGGKQGDLIDLIGVALNFSNQLESLKWANAYLGHGEVTQLDPEVARRAHVRREQERQRHQAQQDERSRKMVGYWATLPAIGGTVVETYLREARGIPLDLLGKLPDVLHYEARAEHADDETGEVTYWPAMVAAIYRGSQPLGIHRTFLQPDGSGKAPVRPSKKMYGQMRGGAIRLTRGASGLTPKDALRRGVKTPLLLGEGIETVLSAACAVPEYRAWAAGSLGNLDIAWPEFVSDVILLKDNDWKPPAMKRFEAIEAHWRQLAKARGGRVKIASAAVGSDFNDWIVA
ncbi:DUF7146 domain-containing protein [Asticcacaulis excentricus]|uniref:Uncharacterized protein n=1 Tax=Asticcacaulis excentricus TaxID=78587 RepID=A0A3G9FZT7_9CAUL|nr:toprim domain-containing protein [Asticcacaulis excentricus]BBF79907.1 hypothetical protein EM6_0484 [Asticcacaulis excentricus]